MNDKKITMDLLTEKEAFPEVNENAINAVNEKNQEIEAENLEIENDVKLKKDGTPAKKRGRKKADFVNPREKAQIETPIETSSIYAATVTSDLLEQVSVVLISKDFKLNELEKSTNIKAWSDTFDYYGGVNLSPPAALALNHAAIILSRVQSSSETKTKFQMAKIWLKSKVSKIFKKGNKDALYNSGQDNERENDLGNQESSSD